MLSDSPARRTPAARAVFPGADPVTGARPMRDAWVWAVLPEVATSVRADGGSLPATLAAARLEVRGADLEGSEPLLLDAAGGLPRHLWQRPDDFIAAAIGGGADFVPERVSRPRRALSLALGAARAMPSALAARRAANEARRSGRAVTLIATSERARPHLLGPGGGALRPRAGCVIAAYRGGGRETALDHVVEALRRAEPGSASPGRRASWRAAS